MLRRADRMPGGTGLFVGKAIGPVLREVGKKRPEAEHGFLSPGKTG